MLSNISSRDSAFIVFNVRYILMAAWNKFILFVQEARLVGFQDRKFLRHAEVAPLCTIDVWCCFVLYFPVNSTAVALVFDLPDVLWKFGAL